MNRDLPLEGLVVLEFAQFLSGPFCGLRLADMGARVIKIERSGSGDIGRHLYLSDTTVGGINTNFQAINRNKESLAVNLKDPADKAKVDVLIKKADVIIQNFRPGVFDRLGFSYEAVSKLNPGIIYASVSGYGDKGPWVDLPGQDLLAQARSGVMWLNGLNNGAPTPIGISIADMLAGHNLTERVLACLVRRGITGKGGQVATNLLESMLDMQFESLTTYLNDGERTPVRADCVGANAYLAAPYGVYETADGFIAIAMTPVDRLMELLGMPDFENYADTALAFTKRQEILDEIASVIENEATSNWLDVLQPHDIWCADVYDWDRMLKSDGFSSLDMVQTLTVSGCSVKVLRPPINIDGQPLKLGRPAPEVGEHTEQILSEFDIGIG